MRIYEIYATPAPLLGELEENKTPGKSRIVAAVVSCFCFMIVAVVIVLRLGALFVLFVLLYSQTVVRHACSFPFSREPCSNSKFTQNDYGISSRSACLSVSPFLNNFIS